MVITNITKTRLIAYLKQSINDFGFLKLLIVAFLVVFHEPVEKLLSNIIVKHLLYYCESTPLNDLIFVAITSVTLYYVLRNRLHFISGKALWLFWTCSLFYLYYRVSDAAWQFTPFQTFPFLKYADILLLITLLFTFAKLRESAETGYEGREVFSFFDDEPLKAHKADKLGYSRYATTIAKKILATQLDHSFAIGVNGKWGMGKTSFFDLVKRELDQEQNIIIDFNAWNSGSPQAIVQDFFNTLQEAFRPYYGSLAQQLTNYSDKLVSVSDTTISRFIKSIIGTLTGHDTASELHAQINEKLRKINKRAIIFIDDLDRLDKQEIIEVVRLIRNTASFRNTFFVVAYDREYVLRAIQDYNPHNYEMFLEKIFQLEINLPFFDRRVFREKLYENLESFLQPDCHEEVKSLLFNRPFIGGVNLDDWITNMRDVTRFSNAVSTTLHELQGEVIIPEFLYLELFRLKFPAAYEHFSRNHRKYLDMKEYRQYKYKYELKDEKGSAFKVFLEANLVKYSIPEGDVRKILDLLGVVFAHNSFYFRDKEYLSVVFPSNFSTYFTYHVTDSKVSAVAFTKARRLPQQDFEQELKSWVEQGLEQEVSEKLDSVNEFDDREDFEKIIRALVFLTTLRASLLEHNTFGVSIGVKSVSDKLYNGEGRITKRYYEDPAEFKLFVWSLLENAPFPYVFEGALVSEWLDDFNENLPVPKEELKQIAVIYLRNYCESSDRFDRLDDHFWRLFHVCSFKRWISQGGGSYMSEKIFLDGAKDIVKAFAAHKDPEGFLSAMITPEMRDKALFKVSDVVLYVWNTWEEFRQFLLTLSQERSSPIVEEFISFYNEFLITDAKVYIPFIFNEIDIKK